jgi:response regulator RpfG family c-di-GMP phosphodiesterase
MTSNVIKILLVEDNPGDARLVKESLLDAGSQIEFELVWVKRLDECLEHLSHNSADIILLDLSLPDSSGFDTFSKLYSQASTLPIILLTGMDDEILATRAVREGAQDYLVKSDAQGALLGRAIQYAIERKQAEEKLARLFEAEKRRTERLSGLQEISTLLASMQEQTEVMEAVVTQAQPLGLSPSSICAIMLIDADTNQIYITAQSGLQEYFQEPCEMVQTPSILQQAIIVSEHVLVKDIDQDAPEMKRLLPHPGIVAFHAYPLIQENRVIGFIIFGLFEPLTPSQEEISAMAMLAERVSLALENARLFEAAQRNLQRLASLRSIDMAISSSLDINLTLGLLLEQVTEQLEVHAANVMILDQETQVFHNGARRGFHTSALEHTTLNIGEGYAGRAALERGTIIISHLTDDTSIFHKSPQFSKEGFCAMVCTPLIAKGKVTGVLEVFHREPLKTDPEWIGFLETLAGQAAIAIDSIQLFNHLQRSNTDLISAYHATIEGWSRALDMRDKETEGHTQRVTGTTMRLAKELGVSEAELIHVQRGALLHDIGKMGIPDSILLKPGPLTDAEWEIMRKHPEFAHELLSSIHYLQPALDIPYCHHEKWDGTGYPRGLKGEQIPLSARLFAVVDVWDALTSDRPYRTAWSPEKALSLIKEEAGKHFDPQVVKVFIRNHTHAVSIEKVTILIVDDDEDIAQSLADELSDQYEVLIANSGKTAMTIMKRTKVSAVLTDQHMPRMTGIQLLEKVHNIKPSVVGILISGAIDQDILSQAINLGNVRGFVSKPFNIDEMRWRLEESLKDQRVASSQPAS